MKKFFALLMFSGIIFAANAQQMRGSFCAICGSRVNFEIDFSKAYIHGMTEQAFAEYEDGWFVDKPEIEGLFLEHLNNGLGGLARFGCYPNADYTLRVEVVDVAASGDFDSDVLLLDGENNEVAKLVGLQAKGGLFGTKLYLIKFGAKHSGNALGGLLYKQLKKCNRKR